LYSAGSTNNFTNTNFTGSRYIRFQSTTDWFNYANDTSSLWLETNNINVGGLTRTLNSWSPTNMSWNDSDTASDMANYTLYGLTTNKNYTIYNNSVLRYTLNSSSCGCLNFTIGLSGSSQRIQVTVDTASPTWSSNVTNNPSNYSSSQNTWMNITWNDNSAVSQVIIESNYSGLPYNYTPSQVGNVYYINPILGVGNYYWKSYANDTTNNWKSNFFNR